MFIKHFDGIFGFPVDVNKEGLLIDHSRYNLAKSFGWSKSDDMPSDRRRVYLSRSDCIEPAECDQGCGYRTCSHYFFSTLTGYAGDPVRCSLAAFFKNVACGIGVANRV